MFCKLICTSFNKIPVTQNSTLGLRGEWVEDVDNTNELDILLKRWGLPDDFVYPRHGSISEILEGTMETGATIHVRIVRF